MRDVSVNHIRRQQSNRTVLRKQVHAMGIGHKNYTASTNRMAMICTITRYEAEVRD